MNKKIVRLDVREELRQGREPFGLIMRTVTQLKPTESFQLIAPFEPLPLYGVMANRGFSHQARELEDGSWEVVFERAEAVAPAAAPAHPPACPERPREVVQLDARGLEPPQPLVTIMEKLAALPAQAELQAQTDRRPVHLLDLLGERGFQAESVEQADGSFLTYIQHRN